MKKIIAFLIPLIIFIGCSSDTDTIKNGVLKLNKTITVGQALDNWKDCSSTKWDEFVTDNGVKVVEFTCNVKSITPFISKIKSDLLKSDNKEDLSYLDITSTKQIFQFTINKDNSFQIDNVQAQTTWKDGKVFEDSLEKIDALTVAYNNEEVFKTSDLTPLASVQVSILYSRIRDMAK